MRVIYFDCFSGISGDMTMAALLDLGIDTEAFRKELAGLKLDGYELEISQKIVSGITGTDVSVILNHNDEPDCHDHNHGHHHEDEHQHEHEHNHDNHHGHVHTHSHNHEERNLEDITGIIDKSSLSQRVKSFSKAVFKEIAEAEARVHNKAVNEVHFHEVGAVDSIVDIVGTAICIDMLGVDTVFSSELHDGKGSIVCRHGTIPVPVPAVMQMLSGSGIPLVSEDVETELVTPTGMALIKYMSKGYGKMPPMLVEKSGYGMGKRETGRFNALRVVMGDIYQSRHEDEDIAVLETNIDDMSPEIMGYTASRLFDAGALDVFYTPIYMKKGRPAFMLTVLSDIENEKKLADIVLMETSTLGIRRTTCKRYCMRRESITTDTLYGKARVKVASMGDFSKAAPEYEDCRVLAEAAGVPLTKVYEAVSRAAEEILINKAKK